MSTKQGRWTRAAALAAVCVAWAGGSWATAAPNVVARPTPDEIKAAWPAAAAKAGVQGVAGMRCRVSVDGSVTDCAPLIETPKNQGFAAALATLTTKYRFSENDAGQLVVLQASWPAWDRAADWPGRPALNTGAFSRVSGAGAALVACIVETDGRLSDCVVADAVGDASVARAALAATKGVKLRPALSQGQPVQSIFTIPIKLGSR